MDEETFVEQVCRFGLTRKEAETYVQILQQGRTTAKRIADETDVSRRHVYNIAENLAERDFVVINDHITPTTIEPAPPNRVYREVRNEVDEMYQKLQAQYELGTQDEAPATVLKSRERVIGHLRTLVDDTEDQLAISLPVSHLSSLSEELRNAVDRDVFVVLILFEVPGSDRRLPDRSLEGLAHVVRFREIEIPLLAAADRSVAMVSSRGVITNSDSETRALALGQAYLESVVFNAFMNTEWELSTQIYAMPKVTLPVTFQNFRLAVVQASLHANAGTEFTVEIEARANQQNGGMTHLCGEVAELHQRLVEPTTDPIPGQCRMDVRREDGSVVSVGGRDAYMEDYGAHSTTLRPK